MKQFLKEFYKYFFGYPVFPTLAVICAVLIVFFTADTYVEPKEDLPVYRSVPYATAITTASTSTTTVTETKTTSSISTSSSATTTTATTTAVTEPPTEPETEEEQTKEYEPPVYSYVSAGDSPNSDFYQDKLVIIGDSIAYGFNAYGYIPSQHNIAKESMGIWNMNRFTFDMGGGAMDIYDAASYVSSPLYYISIGMNDIPGYSPDDLAWNIRWLAEELLDRMPGTTIVIGAITPVSDGNYYTTNDRIREFNDSIQWVIEDLDSSHVLFFNTHDVLCDQNTMALGADYAAGDGLHLNSSAYGQMLNYLFDFLDETSAPEQIEEFEAQQEE